MKGLKVGNLQRNGWTKLVQILAGLNVSYKKAWWSGVYRCVYCLRKKIGLKPMSHPHMTISVLGVLKQGRQTNKGGVQWHSGKASESEWRGPGFDPHSGRHVVSLSKTMELATALFYTQEVVALSMSQHD